MGVEVHSIEELGGKLVEHEHCIVFRLADDVPFTAASMEAASNTETVFGRLTIMYSEEYGGLAIEITEAPTKENLLLALNIQLPLKVELQPSSTDLNILAIINQDGEGPILYIEPTQVVNGKMLGTCIRNLRRLSGLDTESWWVTAGSNALQVSVLDAEHQLEDPDEIDYDELIEVFRPRYKYYGMLIADCLYDENDRLSAVQHSVRILNDEPPSMLDLDILYHLPGVTDVQYDGSEMWPELVVTTAGSEIFAYGDPRKFIESTHALATLIARTAGIHPLFSAGLSYSVFLGNRNTAPKLEHYFNIPSDLSGE